MAKVLRCKVCGAVFEAGVEVCPVCGVGPEHFEEVEAKETAYRNNTGNLYLILGGGIAAVSAAEAIRARDHTGSVVMLTDEPTAPYNRPMLTKKLNGDASTMLVQEPAWYQENGIQIYTDMRIQSIDLAEKEVSLESGVAFRYDRCVYALGAECFVPPIPGADGDNCVSIRRVSDIKKIDAIAKTAKTAAVIGGGVLGLEAAWALKKRGLEVTVIETADRLMARQLSEETSAALRSAAEKSGVAIYTGAQTAGISTDGVALADGTKIPGELVILSCGVRANTAVAKAAGLQVERGVVVDAWMRTSDRNVFACGDCAEFEGVNMALWSEASEQGRIAGANASDDDIVYKQESFPVAFTGFGFTL